MVVIRGCIIDRGCLIVFAFLSLFMFIILYEYLSLLDLAKFKGELDDFVNSVKNVSIVNSTVINNGRLYSIEPDSSDTKESISSTDGLQDQWMSVAAATAPPSSAVSLKILKVIGISMAGGCLVFLFPVALFLILAAIGFTGAGTIRVYCCFNHQPIKLISFFISK